MTTSPPFRLPRGQRERTRLRDGTDRGRPRWGSSETVPLSTSAPRIPQESYVKEHDPELDRMGSGKPFSRFPPISGEKRKTKVEVRCKVPPRRRNLDPCEVDRVSSR